MSGSGSQEGHSQKEEQGQKYAVLRIRIWDPGSKSGIQDPDPGSDAFLTLDPGSEIRDG
jgi:hypothetical protein